MTISPPPPASPPILVEPPIVGDGAAIWRVARDSQTLDLNSSYAYLLWCAHFSATSAVAKCGDEVVGFITAYVPPDQPDTIMVWQVAVDDLYRGRGIALALLDSVVDRAGPRRYRWLKTTIAPSNVASDALFTSFAHQRLTVVSRTPMFSAVDFPDPHEAEELYVIGPIDK